MNMINKEILNYKIISLLGKGGMGCVYLAQNKYIQQQKVAVKVINSNMINDFTRQTFSQEAEKLARLNHPNIVHFLNYHIDEAGNMYLIMEYADGCSLEDYIKNVSGLIVEERICQFFEPILDAFEYAHKQKIIHKDIKPSNIIITKDGIPKILDFGIAALIDEGGKENGNDVVMGTPSYMSPEQVKGEPLDQRSDIYSLGVLLHQMLTGNPPYDTTTLTEHDIYKHVVDDELPRMKAYYKYVSDKVQNIVDKATSKKADLRYQSCLDFKKALHNAIYPSRIPLWAKLSCVAAFAALFIGFFFIWDYNRTKITYYKDYVEQWSIPQGIGKISKSARKHIHRMYRFEYRHYKLQRVSHVNSYGVTIIDNESERYERPIDILFFYNNDNLLSRAKVMDQNGEVQYIKSYNEKLNTVIFQFDDEYGTEKTIGGETVGYVRAFDSNQTKGKISRYLIEYDDKGYVTTLRYAGFQNVLVGDANGIYGKKYVRDDKGRVLEESYLAHDGSPKATKWGLGKKVFSYDKYDNWTSSRYLTVDGEPALDASDGASVCENKYDKYGNAVAQYFKTADGQLMLPGMSGIAGVLYEYDDKGNIRKQSFLGIDGNVEFSVKAGYAVIVAESNEFGFYDRFHYENPDGTPCVSNDGFASVKIVTDSRGNELEKWFYDINDELVLNNLGYAGAKTEYDEYGHDVRGYFYGTQGELCEIYDGYAGWISEYDKMGDVVKQSYFDADMNPTCNNDEISSILLKRDLRGNITEISYLDEQSRLTLNTDGVATIKIVYDDYGNEIIRQLFDAEGQPTKGYLGYAERRRLYDDRGYEISERYYGSDGKLLLVDGIAGTDYEVDGRGNIIEICPVGINEKLATGRLIIRCKYDNKDNEVELAVFRADDIPFENSLGYHKYTKVYNERNQCVEICYYNTKGELTEYGNTNYCIERSEYDERGLKTRVSYLDRNRKPTLYYGSIDGDYSSIASEYDIYGRVLRQYYFDIDGKLTDPQVMVPEAEVKYDRWGNVIYLASLDGHGNLIMNPRTGWAYECMEYDNKENLLWSAYFDDNKNPEYCSDGYHKVVYTYTESNNKETESYFDKDGSPILYAGYHQCRYTYDENNLCIEICYYGKAGKMTDNDSGYSRVTFSYNDDQSFKDRKKYNAAGKMLQHEQYVNGSWSVVTNWQKSLSDYFSGKLPYDFGKDLDNLSIQSLNAVSSSRSDLIFVIPKSKYDMSNTMIETYTAAMEKYVGRIKENLKIPNTFKLVGVLKDSKGRELARKTK